MSYANDQLNRIAVALERIAKVMETNDAWKKPFPGAPVYEPAPYWQNPGWRPPQPNSVDTPQWKPGDIICKGEIDV